MLYNSSVECIPLMSAKQYFYLQRKLDESLNIFCLFDGLGFSHILPAFVLKGSSVAFCFQQK